MSTTRGRHAHRWTVVGAFVYLLSIRQGDFQATPHNPLTECVHACDPSPKQTQTHSWVWRDNGASDLVSPGLYGTRNTVVLLPPPFPFKDALKEEDGRRSHGRGHHGQRERERKRVFLPPDERVMFNFDSTFLTHHHTAFSLVLKCHAYVQMDMQTARTPTYTQTCDSVRNKSISLFSGSSLWPSTHVQWILIFSMFHSKIEFPLSQCRLTVSSLALQPI